MRVEFLTMRKNTLTGVLLLLVWFVTACQPAQTEQAVTQYTDQTVESLTEQTASNEAEQIVEPLTLPDETTEATKKVTMG